MLQQKEISRLLSQAVGGGLHAASLLSANGLPLITVVAPEQPAVSHDNLRMYSLLAVSLHKQQAKTGDGNIDQWDLLELESDLRAVLRRVEKDMFLALFYTADFSDSTAKARLDLVAAALSGGLAGYKD